MKSIDLKKLMDSHGLKKRDVATQLFPGIKYPVLALNRVLKGEALLDTDQISKLAAILKVPISTLFNEKTQWEMQGTKTGITLTTGKYRAELDTNTWLTRVFANDTLFHEAILHNGRIYLSEYIEMLNQIVDKNESSKN